jgi:hypothetical protein
MSDLQNDLDNDSVDEKKTVTLGVRVTPSLRKRLESAQSVTKIPMAAMIYASLESLCDYIETHGSLSMPLATVPVEVFNGIKSKNSTPSDKPPDVE